MVNGVPPPPSGADAQTPWADDRQAALEDKNWADEEKLRGQRGKNRFWFLLNSGLLSVVFMWFFSAVFIASMSVWLIHYLAPVAWQWLNSDQLGKIQTVVFSGSVGALVSAFANRHFSE
ncbi:MULTISPECIES: hypothetical protein [unclassified Aurantimonas]|uniref:hypothetical protein n=1 Tax=unclassified Aurantimonas TaxID=2638230 RepID=UPI002E17E0AD|nr:MULTISPECIES: hypothetical protein [unclassified Aurantimonas]MEC5293494.1 hypothetical protein [Aurantimonas sp. C2-3-R2]MEC5414570.1 hypothetical protein [Aurantimonas sp. C2-4-R8]